jgi:hypothetical protein
LRPRAILQGRLLERIAVGAVPHLPAIEATGLSKTDGRPVVGGQAIGAPSTEIKRDLATWAARGTTKRLAVAPPVHHLPVVTVRTSFPRDVKLGAEKDRRGRSEGRLRGRVPG